MGFSFVEGGDMDAAGVVVVRNTNGLVLVVCAVFGLLGEDFIDDDAPPVAAARDAFCTLADAGLASDA